MTIKTIIAAVANQLPMKALPKNKGVKTPHDIIPVFKAGKNIYRATDTKTIEYILRDSRAVVAASMAGGNDILIDFDHNSEKNPPDTSAAGLG